MNVVHPRALAIGFLALAACGPRANEPDRAETGVETSAAAEVAAPVTPFFEVLRHHAEEAYDQVKVAEWTAARASVDSITAAMRNAPPQDTANRGADLRRSLERLDTALNQRSRRQALGNANYLTKLGALLAFQHEPAMPPEVTLLDHYGRELEIWAEAGDSAKLSETAFAIRATWGDELRPRVRARGATAVAARFDSIVADITAARTPAQYGQTATPLLDEVDVLAALFTK